MRIIKLGLTGLIAGAAMSASAATLDFTEVGADGIVPQTVINLSNATITSFGDDMFIGAPGDYGETNNLGIICASPVADSSCEEDMQIDFADDVSNLTFASFGAAPGDSVEITAFLDGSSVTSVTVTTDTSIDFSAFGAIDSLFFADASSAAGIGFGDFSFEFAIAAIPLPAGLPLMMTGLGGIILLRRKSA